MTQVLSVRLSDEAVVEARHAFAWYRERNPQAAGAFLKELDQAVESIANSPAAWPLYMEGTRRRLLRRFPFSLVYRVRTDHVEVIAVAHQRRRPGYWMER
ncbi:MAG: type II toxin-antitoxin system RelE/ParE family toxin [Burkholderiales bacterium]|nr:type II toxin-antitoxin system RelE/ParE family toxin [Burkholderiales bacterium]